MDRRTSRLVTGLGLVLLIAVVAVVFVINSYSG